MGANLAGLLYLVSGILFILAAIFLPAMQEEQFVMITSNFEPESADTESR